MSKRRDYLNTYVEGWRSMNVELVLSALAEGFVFDDPALPEPVTKATMAGYMSSWEDKTKALSGTWRYENSHEVVQDQDGVLLRWKWWRFTGTNIQGSALTAEVKWQSWDAGSKQACQPRYKTFFAGGDTPTSGLVQGILEYPPGARSLAHWHTPVETYYVLSGTGMGRIGDAILPIGPGDAVFVPSEVVHSFENAGDDILRVLWTLNCDGLEDIDFTFVE